MNRVWTGWLGEGSVAGVIVGGGNGENLIVEGGGGRSWMVDEGGSQVVTPPTMEVLLETMMLLALEVACLTSAILCSLGGADRGVTVTPEVLFKVLMGVRGGGGKVILVSFVGTVGAGLFFSNWQFCNKVIQGIFILSLQYNYWVDVGINGVDAWNQQVCTNVPNTVFKVLRGVGLNFSIDSKIYVFNFNYIYNSFNKYIHC